MYRVITEVEYNHIPFFATSMGELLSLVVRKSAFDIQSGSQEGSPVLTGHLKAAHFVEIISDYEAYVGNTADYADHVNFGTRYQAAQPFFSNSVERVRPSHAEACRQAIIMAGSMSR